LATKRFYGYQSWVRRRRFIHQREVVDLMIEDIRQSRVDHIAITGDLVNIATPAEFVWAAECRKQVGEPSQVTVVPGNHDAYVSVAWDKGLGLWQDHFTSDLTLGRSGADDGPFPFVRTRRNVAIVGLTTAVPTPPLIASGTLGAIQ